MSEYDKPQSYEVYDYNSATRTDPQAQDYSSFAAHPHYAQDYVGAPAQVSSGLPQSTGLSILPSAQQYAAHDPTFSYSQQLPQYPAYLGQNPLRQLPEITSYTPSNGHQGTKVTVYIRCQYDLDGPPPASIVMMFGAKRCDSVLSRTSQQGSPFQYTVSADAPSISSTESNSPHVPLYLSFEGPVQWQSPSVEFGNFTYMDQYPIDSPNLTSKKRKLTPESAERRSPSKKTSHAQLPGPGPSRADSLVYAPSSQLPPNPSTEFARPWNPDTYSQARRFSQSDYPYAQTLPRMSSQQYPVPQPMSATPRIQTGQQNSSYNYYATLPSSARSPSIATLSGGPRSSQLLPSPQGNPPLIRTSTLQQSPTTPVATASSVQTFNPYAMYPANTKATLKIEGELNTMAENWTPGEWEVGRRLVQFKRSQAGSTITATFEPVTLEERLPNSICVSCIWRAEKQECYVTSVDTISLLESLVAVRFTVEEKNRIRRNLEGFRPATVSKTKADSEEFFKLIMGFPNPKPRNIEKDVKVFPWRILATALKKIIGKYSASYSSTAGALHAPAGGPSYAAAGRASDAGIEQQQHRGSMPSPRSTASSVASHGHAYATTTNTQPYLPHLAGGSAGLGLGPSAGTPLAVSAMPPVTAGGPQPQTTSWHPATHYNTAAGNADLSAMSSGGSQGSWNYGGSYMASTPVTGLPGSVSMAQYHYGTPAGGPRMPPLTSQASGQLPESRFVPLHDYENQSHQTSDS